MTDWNPHASDVLGLEWFPTIQGTRAINGPGKVAGLRFRSTVAETIETAYVHIPKSSVLRRNQSRWWLEVYEEGDEIPGAVTTLTTYPSAQVIPTTGWTSTGANFWSVINDDVDSLDTSDYIQYTGTYQDKNKIGLLFASDLGGWPVGRRIVGGRLFFTANREEATGRVQVRYRPSGSAGRFAMGEVTVDTELREFSVPLPEINPVSGLPWLATDIDDGMGGTAWWNTDAFEFKPLGIGKHKPLRIYEARLEIDYVTENRVAVGVIDVTTTDLRWASAELVDPTDENITEWEKAVDTTYTAMVRRLPRWRNIASGSDLDWATTNGGSISWGFLEEAAVLGAALGRDAALPDSYMESYSPTMNSDGTVAVLGTAGRRGYGLRFESTGPAESVDGQPYSLLTATPAEVTDVRGQLVTGAAAVPYPVVRWIGNNHGSDITVQVENQAGPVVVATEDFSPSELTETELGATVADEDLYLYEATFTTPPTLAAATTYMVSVITLDTAMDAVIALVYNYDGDEGEATYGGETLYLDDLGLDSSDQLLTLARRPDAPAAFSTSVDTQTLISDTQVDTPAWLIHSLEFVTCEWIATSLGDDFDHYEVQRSQDGGTTWEEIARITDEAVPEFRDYEGLRNVEATYRMRVAATWYVSSAWTDESAETPVLEDCGLLFVSNEDPTINQGYVDVGGQRQWTFQSGDERETHVLVGRNYQVVTSPLEYRGDRFEVQLVVWAGSVPTDTGRAQFDLIESLNTTAVAYVCVLDETGRRWLADVAVTEGTRSGSKVHEASANIIEVTDTPSLVDVSST